MTLYEQICDLENLYRAAKKAMKGKKSKDAAAKFWFRQEQEIAKIHQELREERYRFGGYTEFQITDNGVTRRISAAPFRDRVVHHAIMQVIEPLFEKSLIYDTYANRKGKGTLKALQRARLFASKYDYVLKLDIKKFWSSPKQIDMDIVGLVIPNGLKRDIGCRCLARPNLQERKTIWSMR